jgi:hypothetical protein
MLKCGSVAATLKNPPKKKIGAATATMIASAPMAASNLMNISVFGRSSPINTAARVSIHHFCPLMLA